jgi:outer membrane protein assembly factor BamA
MRSRRLPIRAALLALVALAASGARAAEPRLTRVEVEGAGALSRGEALDLLAVRPGDAWSAEAESSAVARLLPAYAVRGFLDASVTARTFENPDGVRVLFTVREGKAIPLSSIALEGLSAFRPDDVLSRFDTRAGRTLDASRLESDIDRLLHDYARGGYPFARVFLASAAREERTGPSLAYRVIEGPFLTLGGVRAEGNSRTRLSVIRRLTGLRFGEPYDQEAVDASSSRLMRSGLFRSVSEATARVEWKKKEAVVEMRVEEARTNRIAGAFGYAPGTGGAKGVVSGFADVSFLNILGTARSGGARWESPARETRRVRLFYREPWLLGSPFALGGELEQDVRDSTYSRVSGSLTSDVDLSRRVSAAFSAGLETMRPRREASPVPRSSKRAGGVSVAFEARDVPANPTGGFHMRIGSEYGDRRIEEEPERGIGGARVRQATLDGGWGLYRGLRGRAVLAWEVAGIGRLSSEDAIPSYDQFYLGGARTLRGYEEDQFRGSRIAWSRLELRYLTGYLSRVFLFLDGGYVYEEREEGDGVARREITKAGYGFGLRVDSAIGIVGVDYGLGEGDGWGEGKLHVSAEGDF